MKSLKWLSLWAGLLLFGMYSCEKDTFTPETDWSQDEDYAAMDFSGKYPDAGLVKSNPTERLRAGILELTELTKTLMQDPDCQAELFSLAKTEYYGDQFISLDDVMNPQNSKLYLAAKVSTKHQGAIKEGIESIIEKDAKGSFSNLKYYLSNDAKKTMDATSFQERAALYFYCPYCPDYKTEDFQPTLVPSIVDGDSGLGYIPNRDGTYRKAIIDETYAERNPTLVIFPEDRRVVTFRGDPTDPGTGPGTGPVDPPGGGDPDDTDCDPIHQVHVGHVKLSHNYDSFLSFTGNGGGSEIRVVRIDGYLKRAGDGDITEAATDDLVSIDFSRRDIKRGNWKWMGGSFWDSDWECDNTEQGFGVYEEDTEGTASFKGSLTTKVSLEDLATIQQSIGFDIKVTSKDEIILLHKRSFREFFTVNQIDNGCGLKEGETIFEGEDFSQYDCKTYFTYTLPHRLLD